MKKALLLLILILLTLLLPACGTASKDNVVIVSLSPDLLTGELPPAVASESSDHAQAPCLLVGTFEADQLIFLDLQIDPELEPSGIGSLYSKVQLPFTYPSDWQITDYYGVICTLSTTSSQGPQTISAVFPLTQLGPTESVNQKWTEGSEGEYLVPVIVCSEGEEYYLRSLMAGSLVFHPESPLPPELTEKVIDPADIGPEVSLNNCCIARFSILDKDEDGSYRIEPVCFLSL